MASTSAAQPAPPAPPPPPSPATLVSAAAQLAAAPKTVITNGKLTATVLLPDAEKGFYRGTRFDWAGIVASLKYAGREYYGLWFDTIGPDVRDYVFYDGKIAAGPNTASLGPTDAYDANQPVGWDEAAPGGAFLKIGVGLLRKPTDGAAYNSFRTYEFVDRGRWKVERKPDRVIFTHTVADPSGAYGYVYRKEVRLVPGQPAMQLRHSLTNTGSRKIATRSFNHNFLTLGGWPSRPGLEAGTTFPIEAGRPLRDVAKLEGAKLVYQRRLAPLEVFSTNVVTSPGPNSVYDVHIRDANGFGYRVQGDQPMSSLALWSIRTVVCFEPFVSLEIAPGKTVTWTFDYTYSAPTI